ncbi:hypothetical protein [Pseudoduganella namucuonensis]|uniref:Uncharacterized protein n=1 Tax=Pseudoduganella namucuonensis TaxID=1035707 RepID=A0A1I7M257_9BURK|nr:hypothetical protein [Pseudoduganella namucuonensis]SFV16051.1 hypothetical protein SAMN05216552_104924 [Pseudoduganella namucuonensis]
MQNNVAALNQDATRRIYTTLAGHSDTAWAADAEHYLGRQLNQAAARADGLPPHYELLGDWLGREAEGALAAYRRYQCERDDGAPRRHFANVAQARQFLGAAAPARLTAGASLYGVIGRWNDMDFQPMIGSYLELLGDGVPANNQYLRYQALLESNGCPLVQDLPEACYRGAAVELALAQHCDAYLPELIGYNIARQQPCTALLVARYELNEMGIDADAFAEPGQAAGSGPSALFSLRGIMARVADPVTFYRGVDEGFKLHALVAQLPLPAATPGPQAVMPPRDPLDAPPPRAASYAPAETRLHDRPVIRHHFPADEHAWEAIGSELRLLEARLAASDSKEEAMSTLSRLMSPAAQHQPTGLMAARIYSQLFHL